MAAIYHQIGIQADNQEVYRALTTIEGLSGWWTKTSGNPERGGVVNFHFGDMLCVMKILEQAPDKKVVWQNTAGSDQWLNTKLTFELEVAGNATLVNFTHADWQAVTPFMRHCSTKWAVFLLSLECFLESGTGKPYPDDIAVD
ncbi:MAG: SRPBCC domain-containing protein [Gammaproteobacteria bacterium]|nr:SRPBCC domain-containing protein [Gammaproteobacteria bacterium]